MVTLKLIISFVGDGISVDHQAWEDTTIKLMEFRNALSEEIGDPMGFPRGPVGPPWALLSQPQEIANRVPRRANRATCPRGPHGTPGGSQGPLGA